MSKALWVAIAALLLLIALGNLALVGIMSKLKPEKGPLALHASKEPEAASPYLATPNYVADAMLRAADVKPGEVVYDLGCGDARIPILAARQFGALGVGVELDEKVFALATDNVRKNGVADRVKLIRGNMFTTDLRDANVVALYLLPEALARLRPHLEKQLRPGARVVTHDFGIAGWQSTRDITVPRGDGTSHTVHLYRR